MKRMLGCLLVAAVACLSAGMASAGVLDVGQAGVREPAEGDKVLFYPSYQGEAVQPHEAEIVKVWGPSCVNLTFTDAEGQVRMPSSVMLHQGTSERPAGYFCEYPPAAG
ncbi:MAG: hypothetical protein EON93_18375 [Burkholderiales bacterium]|nr:MAG: hypothetical protein EON93_18375 [Burkholderiales bacterium]